MSLARERVFVVSVLPIIGEQESYQLASFHLMLRELMIAQLSASLKLINKKFRVKSERGEAISRNQWEGSRLPFSPKAWYK